MGPTHQITRGLCQTDFNIIC